MCIMTTIYLDFDFQPIANEVEAKLGLGSAKLIPSPVVNVFVGGDHFWTRGISYCNDQVASGRTPGIRNSKKCCHF